MHFWGNFKTLKMKKTILAILFLPFIAFSQVPHGGKPVYNSLSVKQLKEQIFYVPDELNIQITKNHFPVGYNFSTDITTKNSGIWLRHGKNFVWLYKIKSPEAKGISVIFEDFRLSDGDTLFILDDKGDFIGGFTKDNNRSNGVFPTQMLENEVIIIEFHTSDTSLTKFRISTIVHYFNYFFEKNSGECEININCDTSELWQTLKHSVCRIIYSSGLLSYACSGALIANTQFENIPYFLTAAHCISKDAEAESAVFYFNYESVYCNTDVTGQYKTISGSELISTGKDIDLDFTLLKLNEVPPEDYEPFYAGWDRRNKPPSNSVCIHHPQGDLKKISKDYDSPTIGSFSGYKALTHWKISEWDEGATEGGSSGAPLLNPQGRIIGSLTGGEADCSNPVNDYFEMLYYSWNSSSVFTRQLRHWLDPLNVNPWQMLAYDPYPETNLATISNFKYTTDLNLVNLTWQSPSGADSVRLYRNFELLKTFPATTNSYTDTLPKPGIYAYVGFALYGKNMSQPSEILRIEFGDFEEERDLDVIPFPNPSPGVVFLLLTQSDRKIIKIRITDLVGKEVFFAEKEIYMLDLTNFRQGIYYLTVELDNGDIFTKSIMISPEK